MAGASECVFCAIIEAQTPAYVVLDNGPLLAFLDKRPLFPGHTLVVPKAHRETLRDLPREELEPLLTAAKTISAALEQVLASQGTFVAMNDRISQSVPHVHLHVVPRRKGDGLRGFFWPRGTYEGEAGATLANKLRAVIEREH